MDGGLLGNVLAPLGQLGRAFTPPSLDLSSYDGPEYRYRFLVFRPGLLRQEAVLLGAILLYVLFFWYGSSANRAKAKAWLASHRTIYESQFAVPFDGGDASMGGGLIADGYTDFFAFSTGRRALASLHTVFALRPRHDLAQTLFAFAWKAIYDLSYEPRDELQLDFKLSDEFSSQGAGVPDFVFAVVAKDELRTVKEGRWDLTFTKTSDNNALPGSMSAMTEFADVTDAVFRAAPTLLTALKDPAIEPYFRSLSVTDQPRQYPAKVPFAREHHVILTLAVPPAKSAHVTQPLLRATFALVDALDKLSLRPETKTKLRKVREEFVVRHKDEAGREEREEKAEEKAVLKRRKEEERVMGMSAAEQAKALERDRKRSARKAQGKVVRK